MFAVVKINEVGKGFMNRLKFRLKKPLPRLERINVSKSSYFYYLEIYRELCGSNYSRIPELLSDCSYRVIPCDNYSFDSQPLIRTVKPVCFHQRILINTAFSLLEKRGERKLKICLVDKSANYTDILRNLVSFCCELTVITENEEKYESVNDELFKELGISVITLEKLKDISAYDFIISPDFSLNKLFNNTVILRNQSNTCHDVLRGSDIRLPDKVRAVMPSGVSKLDFAYALFRYCGIESMGRLCFSDFKVICSVG